MTNPTSDGGTIFKTLPGECPWKVRALHVADLQEDVLGHRIAGAGTPNHRVTTTPTNRIATTTHAKPLNSTSAEAAGKERFP
jgi:hypothetical protein